MVGQGHAVLAAGAVRVGCFFFFFLFVFFFFFLFVFFFFFSSRILSSFSNASYLGRRPDILKYCGTGRYNLAVVVSQLLLEACSLSTG